jgi:hypothetical protein
MRVVIDTDGLLLVVPELDDAVVPKMADEARIR